jgi:serine O-acetyltransferase
MKIHAVAHWLWKWHVPLLPTLLYALNRFLFAVDLPAGTHIGRGSVLKHYGLGTVIHRRAIIGERVFINPGVVIGGRSGHKPVPVIEDDVEIGAGGALSEAGRGAWWVPTPWCCTMCRPVRSSWAYQRGFCA